MTNFTIRPIENSDLEEVLEVYRQCEDFLTLGQVNNPGALQPDGTVTVPVEKEV